MTPSSIGFEERTARLLDDVAHLKERLAYAEQQIEKLRPLSERRTGPAKPRST
jgi:hypothetical protein